MGEASRLVPGDRIGDYRIELVLDRGMLWDLCAAVHVVLPRLATIRVARPGLAPAAVWLLREACIVEALSHPGVPRLYDCGRLVDRRPWVATEQVGGQVLAETIGAGPLPPVAVAALVRDVAAILEHAHRRGIVHGLVRPATILLTDPVRGSPVCLCDWSEARALDAEDGDGAHEARDGSVDVLALGVVANQALAGTVTGPLARLLDRMLAEDPGRRPTSAVVRATAARIEIEIARELAEKADLATAMLAVEEITLSDLDDGDGGGGGGGGGDGDGGGDPYDDDDVEMVIVPPATALGRMRRPKWTPPFGGHISSEESVQVSGEIDSD